MASAVNARADRAKWIGLQLVNLAVLFGDVVGEVFAVELLAGGVLGQLLRGIESSMHVNLFAEPREQLAEFAVRDFVVQRGNVTPGGGEELRGVKIAERIGGEVADHSARPVNVLQYAQGIVWDVECEKLLHFGIPGTRQIFDSDLAFEQGHFDFESQNNVQVVGDLVGLHANERRVHDVDGAVETIERKALQRLRECLLQG